jgi:hypothetical protein
MLLPPREWTYRVIMVIRNGSVLHSRLFKDNNSRHHHEILLTPINLIVTAILSAQNVYTLKADSVKLTQVGV